MGRLSDMDDNAKGSPDPYPASSPGPARGGVPPGETPPAESSTGSETGPRGDQSRGWGKGPLIVLSVIVLLFAAFFLAYALLIDL
ncbi:DUF6480 family protein [Streptomyces sp. NPDC020965]|uniref:DUF6480 family protein n=1 Tax=Streptomyces sp. NPDC020965 TaxID=3365105 RepID=UPI0037A36763